MADLTFLPGADADYQEALDWYVERSPRAAAGFEAAVEVALQRIRAEPTRWSAVDDRHRFYVLKRYPFSIVYRAGAEIVVVAVAHSSRSATYWAERN